MTGITKCYSFITKYEVLQSATVLLKNMTGITKCYSFITKYDRYYKVRRLLKVRQNNVEVSYHQTSYVDPTDGSHRSYPLCCLSEKASLAESCIYSFMDAAIIPTSFE